MTALTRPGCGCDGTLTVIDPTTNAVTATVQVGIMPNAIVVDPSTHNVYVENISDGTWT